MDGDGAGAGGGAAPDCGARGSGAPAGAGGGDGPDCADRASLSLAYSRLTEVSNTVADKHGAVVRYLDLSHNNISNLQCLARFERLGTLVLDHNCMTSLTIPPPLPHLHTLWVNHNRITELTPFLRALRYNCPGIQHLSMIGNPAVPALLSGDTRGEFYRYRILVLTYFPRLLTLDQQHVEAWERPECDTIWAKVTSPDNWRDLQRKVSVMATDAADQLSERLSSGLDRLSSWLEARRSARQQQQRFQPHPAPHPPSPPPPRNTMI